MTLDELQAQRAALPDDDDQLPASTTRGDLKRIQLERINLDRRIANARRAAATLASTAEPDPSWFNLLTALRQQLCDELLALAGQRIRDPKLLGLQTNITLSIRCID